MVLRIVCVATLALLIATIAQGESTQRARQRQNRTETVSVAQKLQEPARIQITDGQKISFGNLLDQIREHHGLRVHLYRGTAMLMARTLQEGVVPEDQMASLLRSAPARSRSGAATVGGIGLMPTHAPPTYASPYEVSAATSGTVVQNYAPPPYMPTAGNGPVPLNSLVASPDNETPITDQPATQSGAVVQTTPPVSPPPVEVDESESEQEINDIEAGVHALGACEELFRRSNVTTTALRGRGLTVESLIRQALAQIGTPFDLDDDMAGLPATYTHAYDWDLLVGEDCVFITTRLQVNLHKEARVYRIPAALEVSAEELAVVIRRTVRPWSWRAQIDEVIGSIEMELPPEASLPAIPRVTGIDLTGAGDLVQIAAADVDATEADKGPERADSAAAWYSIKALGSLLSSGTIAAAHAVINTTEMLHYADPPTATMQVLPGMLIVSQSQGAHREIADLFQLIEDSARN